MTASRKRLAWVGAIFARTGRSMPATGIVFYAWLDASNPRQWPAERARSWVHSSLAIALFLLGICIPCVRSIVRAGKNEAALSLPSLEDHEEYRDHGPPDG